ncbi:MAG: hypothetical protein HYV07_03340 [Deltaproteobacteria bacterium]|nr:hypothetical protein [Deltaproteobacteria bacterium]
MGIGDERARFQRIVEDERQPLSVRRAVLSIFDAPAEIKLPTLATVAIEDWLDLLAGAADDEDSAGAIADFFTRLPAGERDGAFDLFELSRKRTATSAARAYRAVLLCADLAALQKRVTQAIALEPASGDVELLEALASKALRKPVKRELARVAAEARAKARDPSETLLEDTIVYVSECDGQGAFVVAAAFPTGPGRYFASHICIRASEDFRDGMCEPNLSRSQFEKLVAMLRDQLKGMSCQKIRVNEAATLIREAIERTTQLGQSIPESIRPAVDRFSAVVPAPLPVRKCLQGVAPSKSDGFLREVLRRRGHRTWFFDPGDLASAGARVPKCGEEAEWIRLTAAKLLRDPAIRARLRGMTVHAANWYAWKGDLQAIAILAAAHTALASGTDDDALVLAMLEHTLELRSLTQSRVPSSIREIGDPIQRDYLRTELFPKISRPTGRDLATLDLIEVATHAFEVSMLALPGYMRPRADVLHWMAEETGRTMALLLTNFPVVTGGVEPTLDSLRARCAAKSGLSGEVMGPLLAEVVREVYSFIERVCDRCQVQCLSSPDEEMGAP